jgi:membrane associated rhomboid family serine protease
MLDDRSYMRTPYRPGWSMTTILLITLVGVLFGAMLLAGFKTGRLGHGLAGVEQGRTGARQGLSIAHLPVFAWIGIMHLLMNMIGLYFFGRAMEEMLGSRECSNFT